MLNLGEILPDAKSLYSSRLNYPHAFFKILILKSLPIELRLFDRNDLNSLFDTMSLAFITVDDLLIGSKPLKIHGLSRGFCWLKINTKFIKNVFIRKYINSPRYISSLNQYLMPIIYSNVILRQHFIEYVSVN